MAWEAISEAKAYHIQCISMYISANCLYRVVVRDFVFSLLSEPYHGDAAGVFLRTAEKGLKAFVATQTHSVFLPLRQCPERLTFVQPPQRQ